MPPRAVGGTRCRLADSASARSLARSPSLPPTSSVSIRLFAVVLPLLDVGGVKRRLLYNNILPPGPPRPAPPSCSFGAATATATASLRPRPGMSTTDRLNTVADAAALACPEPARLLAATASPRPRQPSLAGTVVAVRPLVFDEFVLRLPPLLTSLFSRASDAAAASTTSLPSLLAPRRGLDFSHSLTIPLRVRSGTRWSHRRTQTDSGRNIQAAAAAAASLSPSHSAEPRRRAAGRPLRDQFHKIDMRTGADADEVGRGESEKRRWWRAATEDENYAKSRRG